MSETTESILERQQELLGLISRAFINVRKLEVKKRTPRNVQTRIDALDANWTKFVMYHDKLSCLKAAQKKELPYFLNNVYSECEETYVDAKAEMLEYLDELQETQQDGNDGANTTFSERRGPGPRQLPRISLPHFSGSYSAWTHFRDLFTSMVRFNTELTSVEKLQYLNMSLTGEAAQLLKNISITGENFERAWTALVSRYENKRVLLETHLTSLVSARQVPHESANELKRLLGDVKEAIGALEAIDTKEILWDSILVYMTTRKLDPDSLKDWEKNLGNQVEPPTFADLENFLLGRTRALEAFERVSISKKLRSAIPASQRSQPSAKSHQASVSTTAENSTAPPSTSTTLSCSLCNSTHYISSCPDYRKKTPEQRREIVTQKNLCFNCLGPHQIRNCRTAKRCQQCGQPHHTSIHRPNGTSSVSHVPPPTQAVETLTASNSAAALAPPRRDPTQGGSTTTSHVAATVVGKYTPVFLATALVNVVSCYGDMIEVRALLDQGSEVSFVTESLAQRLNLPRRHVSLPINGIGGNRSSIARSAMALTIHSRLNPKFSCSVDSYVLAKLTSYLPPIRVVATAWPHLEDLSLADPEFSSARSIDLVLGAEIYSRILEDGLRKGPLYTPVAQNSALGWIISGPGTVELGSHDNDPSVSGLQCSVDHELLDLMQRFWIQEETAAAPTISYSNEEAQCEEQFASTYSRTKEGRYIVRLPLKRLPIDLGDSYGPAFRMLTRQEKRFANDNSLKKSYADFLSEYEALGHMTLAAGNSPPTQRIFYLPHHAVVRESSTTTKLRVVFNGSQRSNFGIAVNDLLHVGPKIQTDLADVITRWRRYAVVFSADIEKMYRQILVHQDDWDLQRILWREKPEDPPLSYQLCTVTYGLTCAPYLALKTLRQLALDEGHRFPRAVEIVQRETYVDDVLSGADNPLDAQQKIAQIDELLKAGGFTLQKWTSNCEEILNDIPLTRHANAAPLSLTEDHLVRALGISWQPSSDSFVFASYNPEKHERFTKRVVLSTIAQLFDPLGWLAPVVVRAKIFMQELWSAGLEWDQLLPHELATRWKKDIDDLQAVSTLAVPRWLGSRDSSIAVELHGFSDASQAALGAVIYLRVVTDFDNIRVSLVSAKTRVAPLKQVTIPRLELSAALLLVRQISHIRKVLDLEAVPVHLWTDSTVALAYIEGQPDRWADYVRNRVTEIRELSNSRWHHVPGKENPADCASRGSSPLQLKNNPLWWSGPEWLQKHSAFWPSSTPPLSSNTVFETRAKSASLAVKSTHQDVWDLVQRFSKLNTLLRITAWIVRITHRFKKIQGAPGLLAPLTPAEIDKARVFWVKKIQQLYFASEMQQLSEEKQLSRSSQLVRLAPFVDAHGFLRVGGRLKNSLLDYDEKHPLILPRDSALTTLVIDHAHRRTLHGGTQVTLVALRRQYWILGGRVPVRGFIYRCIQCVRYRATTGQQLMGQLPQSRSRCSRPFLHSGVDYAGPISISTFRGRGAKSFKGYIVVFVCLSSSAVHLELVSDYSTEGFIAAFKRFTGRRGICATLASDCGTNLVGADRELRKLFQASSREFSALASLLANDGTQWKFNPPSAPHFGGKWEAAVKSVKFHLKRVIGDTLLTFEEYSTLLVQIEAVLNSRPLCPLSDDPSDLTALTPGHFLIGNALTSVPEPSLTDLPRSRLSRWQLLRQMLDHFWNRWSSEYLQKLQSLSKWQQQRESFKIGSLVLVKDERYPPSKWALARVIDVHPGDDGLVRVATVKTQSSTFKRPIVKLCLLPVSSQKKEEEDIADSKINASTN